MALDFVATYKVLVLGDSNVGKTCIVHRYCDEKYYDTYISTIGKNTKYNNEEIKLPSVHNLTKLQYYTIISHHYNYLLASLHSSIPILYYLFQEKLILYKSFDFPIIIDYLM